MSQLSAVFHQWRRGLKPAFASISIRCFGRLPLMWNRTIGSAIGHLIWWSRGKSVKISLDNISRAFPELTPEKQFAMTKASIIETGKTALEVPSIWIQAYRNFKPLITNVENLELIQQPNESKKGMLILAPHLGNWEFFGSFLAEHLDITIIYQPSGVDAMDNLVVEGRCRDGVKLAPANRQGVALVLQALRDGKGVGILPDQVPERDSGGAVADFFGQKAWTMTLVHKLIKRTHCAAVMAYAKRVPKGFNLVFAEPDSGIFSDNEIESLNGLNRSVESCVRAIPEQYQWEYKRFKRTNNLKEGSQ